MGEVASKLSSELNGDISVISHHSDDEDERETSVVEVESEIPVDDGVEIVYTFTPSRKRPRGDGPVAPEEAPPAPKKKFVPCCTKRKANRLIGTHSAMCINFGTNEAFLVATKIN